MKITWFPSLFRKYTTKQIKHLFFVVVVLTAWSVRASVRDRSPKQRLYLFPPLVYFRARSDAFKAPSVYVSALTPQAPVGMMYARTGMPTMNTLNHHGLVQIGGLMRTIWTTVTQTPGLRWMAFLSILGEGLSFSVPLTFHLRYLFS